MHTAPLIIGHVLMLLVGLVVGFYLGMGWKR